jgi:hypothetical protein
MKLNKLNSSIKTRFSFKTIGINFFYVFIGVIILLAFIVPYLSIFLDKTSTVKVFGFRNLRTFTYVIGLPSSLMVCSFLLLYISLKTKYSIGRLASYLFLYSSLFQFIWIFWDAADLPKTLYHISIAIASLFTAIFITKILIKTHIKRAANEKEFRQNAKKFIAEVKSRMDDQQIDSL